MSFKKELQKAYGILGQNASLIYLTPDVGKSVNAYSFKSVYGQRFINVGIAEQNAICMSAGLATEGFTVLLSAYAVFASGRGWELIRNYICYPNLNVKIIATHGGLNVGQDGVTHQATEDMAIMRAIPNMTVLSVADPEETLEALQTAIEISGPVYVRLGRADLGSFEHKAAWRLCKRKV
jgi:transketolase